MLWALVDAGLVKVCERRDRRGEWEPYRWALTEEGRREVADDELPVDVAGYLAVEDDSQHEVLRRIRRWLVAEGNAEDTDPVLTALLVAIGQSFRRGRVPCGRLLSIVVGGDTKEIRVDRWAEEIEAALDLPFDEVVRLHGQSVLAYGGFTFDVRGHEISGDWSIPWLAMTADTIEAMENLRVHSRTVVTVENLVAFEEYVRREISDNQIALFTGGFPSRLVHRLLCRLCDAGVEKILHWGDLDLGGLRIFRHLRDTLPARVEAFRMEPKLLEQLPTRPLTATDREGLRHWREDDEAPLKDLAVALLERGVKVEQEAWFL